MKKKEILDHIDNTLASTLIMETSYSMFSQVCPGV